MRSSPFSQQGDNYLLKKNYQTITSNSKTGFTSPTSLKTYNQPSHLNYLKSHNPFQRPQDHFFLKQPSHNHNAQLSYSKSNPHLGISRVGRLKQLNRDHWKEEFETKEREILKNYGPEALRYRSYENGNNSYIPASKQSIEDSYADGISDVYNYNAASFNPSYTKNIVPDDRNSIYKTFPTYISASNPEKNISSYAQHLPVGLPENDYRLKNSLLIQPNGDQGRSIKPSQSRIASNENIFSRNHLKQSKSIASRKSSKYVISRVTRMQRFEQEEGSSSSEEERREHLREDWKPTNRFMGKKQFEGKNMPFQSSAPEDQKGYGGQRVPPQSIKLKGMTYHRIEV